MTWQTNLISQLNFNNDGTVSNRALRDAVRSLGEGAEFDSDTGTVTFQGQSWRPPGIEKRAGKWYIEQSSWQDQIASQWQSLADRNSRQQDKSLHYSELGNLASGVGATFDRNTGTFTKDGQTWRPPGLVPAPGSPGRFVVGTTLQNSAGETGVVMQRPQSAATSRGAGAKAADGAGKSRQTSRTGGLSQASNMTMAPESYDPQNTGNLYTPTINPWGDGWTDATHNDPSQGYRQNWQDLVDTWEQNNPNATDAERRAAAQSGGGDYIDGQWVYGVESYTYSPDGSGNTPGGTGGTGGTGGAGGTGGSGANVPGPTPTWGAGNTQYPADTWTNEGRNTIGQATTQNSVQGIRGDLLGQINAIAGEEYVPYTAPTDAANYGVGSRIAGMTDLQRQAMAQAPGLLSGWQEPFEGALNAYQSMLASDPAEMAANFQQYSPNYLAPHGQWALQQGMGALGSITPGAGQSYGDMFQAGIGQYMNPYTSSVMDVMAQRGQQNLTENLLPQVNSTFAGQGQFGSTRNSTFVDRALQNTNDLIMRQQAELANQNYNQAAGQFNTGWQNTAQLGQNLLGTGASAYQNAASNYMNDRSNTLSGMNNMATLGNNYLDNAQQQLQQMYNMGGLEQQQQQQSMNLAYQDFERQRLYPQQQLSWQLEAMTPLLNAIPNAPTMPSVAGVTGAAGQFQPNMQQAADQTGLNNFAQAWGTIGGLGQYMP